MRKVTVAAVQMQMTNVVEENIQKAIVFERREKLFAIC